MTDKLTTVQPTAIVPAAPDLGPLMALAIEKGPDGVEALERMSALLERREAKDAHAQFTDALASFQSECPSIPKKSTAKIATKSGASYSYNFADLDTIVSTVRPILRKHGLSFTFDSDVDDQGRRITTTCSLRHKAGHSESSSFTCPLESSSPRMSAQQKYGGAYTFSRRYALVGVLGLATTDDTDGRDGGAPEDTGPPISEHDAANIASALEELGADVPAFCRWLGADSIDTIPESRKQQAWSGIERKRKS